ncbi:hypothetical protein C2E23DRAFT_887616 [Lenzites betulinus]|nr:hypothetical protein C2E23DRAFT_887616 [Lenzites betulinus]
MAVLPRSSGSAGADGQIMSPRVATSTVVGMVLGILCLFTIVVSYQLLSCPCKRKKQAAKRVPRATIKQPSPHTPSTPTHSFITLKNLCKAGGDKFRFAQPSTAEEKQPLSTPGSSPRRNTLRSLYLASTKPFRSALRSMEEGQISLPATESARTPNLRERRALRSLHLNTHIPITPTKRYPLACNPPSSPVTPTRKRMAGLLHLNGGPASAPGSPTLFAAQSTKSRRLYQKLDDTAYSDWSNEESYRTERPVSALISPWSPSEYEFPYPSLHSPGFMSAKEPSTPPPLYPPPPAYIPEVPMRSPGSAPASPVRPTRTGRERAEARSPLAPPVSPIVSTLTEEIVGGIDTWSLLSHDAQGTAMPPDPRADGVFVIASEESEDGTSCRDSLSTIRTDESAYTWEACDV